MAEKRIETVEMRAGDVKTGFGNPRKITKKKKDELRNSIETFGDFGSFIIDEDDNIIGGNMRLSVIKEMNPDTIILCKCEMWAAYLRKGIRTLDMELAGYAIHNLRQTDLSYAWKTLYVISRNECKGIPTREIVSLKQSDGYVNKNKGLDKRDEIYICKGIMVLMYQICGKFGSTIGNDIMDAEFLVRWDDHEYIDIRTCELPDDIVPEWVYDVHTIKGKRAGKTDWGMNLVEQEALSPLQVSFFDEGSWQPRYEYKHLHNLCTEGEYQEMLEYSKTRRGNPVDKIQDKY